MIEIQTFIILLLMLFINIALIIKPKIPLLNILFGLFFVVFTMYSNSDLPYNGMVTLLFVMIGVVCVASSIVSMSKNKK